MTLLRRATDQTQSEWVPVPEGLFRWIVGKPELKLSEKFGNYQVRFPLALTQGEIQRVKEQLGDPPDGMQQSYRVSYSVGLSLGYVQKDGQYKSTKLVDVLAACLGSAQTKKFREWVAQGGGPPRPTDLNDQKAELDAIEDWLGWWEGLEVYGTITHADDTQQKGVVWARFAGPLPVGSLPNQKDEEYQAHGRGKLRAIISASGETREANGAAERQQAPAEQFTADGAPVGATAAQGDDELPF